MDTRAGLRNLVVAVLAAVLVAAIQGSPLIDTKWFLPFVVFVLVLVYLMLGDGGKRRAGSVPEAGDTEDSAQVAAIRAEAIVNTVYIVMFIGLIGLGMFGDRLFSLLEKMVGQ